MGFRCHHFHDDERSTIQYYKKIPRGAKDHDYPRTIHMKNVLSHENDDNKEHEETALAGLLGETDPLRLANQ